jgi:hypothetical protein
MGPSGPEVQVLSLSDARWSALVAAHPGANIFHHPAWTELLAECYGFRPFVVGTLGFDGVIRAGLPVMEVGGLLTGRRWISLPFTDHLAPLDSGADSLSNLAAGVVGYSRSEGVAGVELRYAFPGRTELETQSRHVLHTLPLRAESATVFEQFVPMHRRNIGVAEKKGVRIAWGNQWKDVEAFYRLHLETRQRKGMPVQPRRFFELLARRLLDRGLGFVLLAHKDGACLAGAVYLHWRRTLTYKFGASGQEGLSLRPNNLLMWTAIRWGCENGFVTFDMGRTDLDNHGLREFKSGWGTREAPLTYSTLSRERQHSLTESLMPVLRLVIRNSPPWVCRATGELLYKHFGA